MTQINKNLAELNEAISTETKAIYQLKRKGAAPDINQIILRYTSIAKAVEIVSSEEYDSAKLLGLSQVLDKWVVEACL
jgi:hypothetical protein